MGGERDDKPPWKKKAPATAKHTSLSPPEKAAARRRAAKAGRTYPTLVDNMWAARRKER
jgi:hypothetical protein